MRSVTKSFAFVLALSIGACGGSDSTPSSNDASSGDSNAPIDSTPTTDTAPSSDAAVDADADVAADAIDEAEIGESGACDLSGTWTGTITYPIAGCGGASPTSHDAELYLTQIGTVVSGTDLSGAKVGGSILGLNVDLSTDAGTVYGEYVGTIDAACTTITGTWHDSLECDSGPFTLKR